MKNKLPLRVLLVSLFAILFASVASADIYVTASSYSGSSISRDASAPYWENTSVVGPIATSMYLTNAGTSNARVTVVFNSNNPTGNYFVGEVWDDAWVDFEDVYVTLN
jgi:hypothetical protein